MFYISYKYNIFSYNFYKIFLIEIIFNTLIFVLIYNNNIGYQCTIFAFYFNHAIIPNFICYSNSNLYANTNTSRSSIPLFSFNCSLIVQCDILEMSFPCINSSRSKLIFNKFSFKNQKTINIVTPPRKYWRCIKYKCETFIVTRNYR